MISYSPCRYCLAGIACRSEAGVLWLLLAHTPRFASSFILLPPLCTFHNEVPGSLRDGSSLGTKISSVELNIPHRMTADSKPLLGNLGSAQAYFLMPHWRLSIYALFDTSGH